MLPADPADGKAPSLPLAMFLSSSCCDVPAPGPWVLGGPQPLALPFQLPDKLIPSLVKYYYSWKKTRSRTSVMDRQARRLGGRKDKEDRWGGPGCPGAGQTELWGPWPLCHALPGACVHSDELEEGRGAVSEGEPDAGDPKREVRSGSASLPALSLGSIPPTPLLFLAASALSAPEYPPRPREKGGPGFSVPPPSAANPASPTQGHVPEP